MINLIINISTLVANIKWLVKVLLLVDKKETEKLRAAIKEGSKLAKEQKDPSILNDIINGVNR